MSQSGHNHCLICGSFHPNGWGLAFECDEEGEVWTKCVAGSDLQGYDNIMHGGVVATLLDAAMTHCLFHCGIQAVTGELRVRYLHPVACNVPIELRARLLFSCSPLYQLQADLHCGGQRMARAEGKFMRRSIP